MNHPAGDSSEDKYLVDRVLNGDARAFNLVIRNTERLVAQIVFRLVPVAEDRKDLAQDIYLKAFHKLPGFKFQSRLSTWIARIAYNTCLSWLEKKKPVLPGNLQEDDEGDECLFAISGHSLSPIESQVSQKELTLILRKEIAGLPPVYQTLITLFHQESLSYEMLSEITGLPEGTVKSYLFRARRMMKENLLSKYKKEAL